MMAEVVGSESSQDNEGSTEGSATPDREASPSEISSTDGEAEPQPAAPYEGRGIVPNAFRPRPDTLIYVPVKTYQVTRDKLENLILRQRDRLTARQGWVAPLGLLLTLVLVLVTAEFREALGIDADVWQAFFIFFLIAMVIWLAAAARGAWINRGSDAADAILRELEQSIED